MKRKWIVRYTRPTAFELDHIEKVGGVHYAVTLNLPADIEHTMFVYLRPLGGRKK